MDQIICFIDDSGFEHDLVRNEIAPFAQGFRFIQAYTFQEAQQLLEGENPALFLLDLWGKDENVPDPHLPPRKELEKRITDFPDLDYVFQNLDDFEGDLLNEYLKRLFSIVDSWRSLFEEVCNRAGQNRKYGLSNLGLVRKHYPGIPAVFYTRKSLISDAVAMFGAGANGLFVKPTGSNDMETARLTREYAPQLITGLARIMNTP